MKKIFVLIAMLCIGLFQAQILGALKDQLGKVGKDKAVDLLGSQVMNAITTEAITTNFKDCDTKNIKGTDFAKGQNFTSLCSADFTTEGYILKPGYYEIDVKSFCLKAGTYAPSKGDGYLYAPLKGPREEIIDALIKNWYKNQDIEQSKLQMLIWAIIAKTKFKDLDISMQAVATKLLTKKQLLSLTKMGLDFIPSSAMDKAKSSLPSSVQKVLDAENNIRSFFSTSGGSYSEIEEIAILAGINPEKSSIEYGTWGLHPDGFWISYHPSGYTQMKIRIYVPESLTEIKYIPSEDVAVPANTGSQRLMVSDVLNCK